MQKLASITFIIASCVVFLVLPIILLTYLTPYYFNAFDRYQVYNNFAGENRSKDELNIRFTHVLHYIQLPFNTTLEPEFFSHEDIMHMQDVQSIFIYLYVILGIALAAQIGAVLFLRVNTYRTDTAVILQRTEKAIGLILLAIIVLGALFLLTWDRSFIIFHQILFPLNNYWNLDPTTSNLIKFLPFNIFQELLALYLGFLAFEYATWKIGSVAYKHIYT